MSVGPRANAMSRCVCFYHPPDYHSDDAFCEEDGFYEDDSFDYLSASPVRHAVQISFHKTQMVPRRARSFHNNGPK